MYLDAEGGRNYTEMGSAELLSVPYAFYAQNTGSGSNSRGTTEWDNDGTDIYVSPAFFPNANVGVGISSPMAKLHVFGQGFSSPSAPMLQVEHQNGFTSTTITPIGY